MLSRLNAGFAVSAVLLGLAHLIFGFAVFPKVDPNLLWFLGAGIAMVVTGLANFQRTGVVLLRIQNCVTVAYIAGLAFYIPQPQVLLGLFLFTGLLVFSLRKSEP